MPNGVNSANNGTQVTQPLPLVTGNDSGINPSNPIQPGDKQVIKAAEDAVYRARMAKGEAGLNIAAIFAVALPLAVLLSFVLTPIVGVALVAVAIGTAYKFMPDWGEHDKHIADAEAKLAQLSVPPQPNPQPLSPPPGGIPSSGQPAFPPLGEKHIEHRQDKPEKRLGEKKDNFYDTVDDLEELGEEPGIDEYDTDTDDLFDANDEFFNEL